MKVFSAPHREIFLASCTVLIVAGARYAAGGMEDELLAIPKTTAPLLPKVKSLAEHPEVVKSVLKLVPNNSVHIRPLNSPLLIPTVGNVAAAAAGAAAGAADVSPEHSHLDRGSEAEYSHQRRVHFPHSLAAEVAPIP